jgi:hypothetical protein
VRYLPLLDLLDLLQMFRWLLCKTSEMTSQRTKHGNIYYLDSACDFQTHSFFYVIFGNFIVTSASTLFCVEIS